MKFGILTFCNANNYGAILQAYSLQKKLEEIGIENELIDYRCPAIEAMHAPHRLSIKKIPKANLYTILENLVFARRRRKFQQFRLNMKISRAYFPETINQTNMEYDAFIVGSDQVFNLKLTNGDKAFFLDFAGDEKTKIAFAASIGDYVKEEKEDYVRLLSRFDYLSVREKSSVTLLETELGLDCHVLPDPVFLHSREEWIELLGAKRKKQGYVLVYSLHNKPELYLYANRLAQEKGIKVVSITKYLRPAGKADTMNRHASPKDFIELILNADYFITDSFHGTAFSLIFRKQFFVFLPQKYQERITDLLDEVGLQDRIVSVLSVFPNEIKYDEYESVLVQYVHQTDEIFQKLKEIC